MCASTFGYVLICCVLTGATGIPMEYMVFMGKRMQTCRTHFVQSSHHCNHKCLPPTFDLLLRVCAGSIGVAMEYVLCMCNIMQTRRNNLLVKVHIFVIIGVCLYV